MYIGYWTLNKDYYYYIIYVKHNIWWEYTIVGYNNYAHTVIRVTPSYMISIVLALEHSRFDEHVPLKKISYLFNYKQCALFHHVIMCHLLYSLIKTMCLVIYYVILALNPILRNLYCPQKKVMTY